MTTIQNLGNVKGGSLNTTYNTTTHTITITNTKGTNTIINLEEIITEIQQLKNYVLSIEEEI